MKLIYPLVAAVLSAGLLSSCDTSPYASETGGSQMRTSGAYSAQFRGQGSTFHTRDLRDPTGDWRHDDDERGGPVTGYVATAPRYVSYSTWRPDARGPAELPTGARRVMIEGQVYYTHDNVWYQPTRTGFRIVASPF